jgi:ATP-dependent exoDNAse (exonuclease V) alpha subunit
MQALDINSDFKRALDVMETTNKNVFITGKAGTGKSTLLNYFREKTDKKIVVLAPTGVAAINVRGQTIHSFFKFKPSVTLESIKKLKEDNKKNIYQKIKAIVIDEISMVRADLLDCMDKFLRLNSNEPDKPFGGIQMIFIGDLFQLPPVVTSQERALFQTHYQSPYFFSARFFETFQMEFIELEKIYRQQDERFIALLNSIRNKSTTDEDIAHLNGRVGHEDPHDTAVYLTPKNIDADRINAETLEKLQERLYTFEASIEGTFGREYYPTHQTLRLKAGAQIMMVMNDSKGRWVNGSMGKISRIVKREGGIVITVELESGEDVDISPYTWEVHRFVLEAGMIKAEAIGSFTQYPIVLAWALTIHKSQGKTFNKVTLDMGGGAFMPGQVYVALSRCTTFEGLTLKKPIQKQHIWLDYNVLKFVTQFQYNESDKKMGLNDKISFIEECIKANKFLEITYLKANNEKSKRIITPTFVGEMTYKNKIYLGMQGFCHQAQEQRTFRVDRILEMQEGLNTTKSPVAC